MARRNKAEGRTLSSDFLADMRASLEALYEAEKSAVTDEEREAVDRGYESLSKSYLEELLKTELSDSSFRREGGEPLSYEGWHEGIASREARKTASEASLTAEGDYLDSLARAKRGKGSGSGYGEYLAKRQRSLYEASLAEAAEALSASYGEYRELEAKESETGSTTDDRLKTVSYIASNAMTEREGLLYALAAGLSYEEASTLAHGAVLLNKLLNQRYTTYGGSEE